MADTRKRLQGLTGWVIPTACAAIIWNWLGRIADMAEIFSHVPQGYDKEILANGVEMLFELIVISILCYLGSKITAILIARYHGEDSLYSMSAYADTAGGEWVIRVYIRNHGFAPLIFRLSKSYTFMDGKYYQNHAPTDVAETNVYKVPPYSVMSTRVAYGAVTPVNPPACGFVLLTGTVAGICGTRYRVDRKIPFYYGPDPSNGAPGSA